MRDSKLRRLYTRLMLRASLEKTLAEVVMISMFTLKVVLVLISVERNLLSSSP